MQTINTKKWWLSDAEYSRLNPPIENVRMIKGEIWYQWIDDPNWLPVGYIPTPNYPVMAWLVVPSCKIALKHVTTIEQFCQMYELLTGKVITGSLK